MDKVIYYPATTPPLDWLKRAALMWDEVARITAYDAPEDPPDVALFSEALGGILTSIDPTRSANTREVFKQLLDWLDAREASDGEAPDGLTREVYIYSGKMDDSQIKKLVDRGAARLVTHGVTEQLTPWEIDARQAMMMEARVRFGADMDTAPPEYQRVKAQIAELQGRARHYPEGVRNELCRLEAEAKAFRERHLRDYDTSRTVVAMQAEVADYFLSLVAAGQGHHDIFPQMRRFAAERTDIAASAPSHAMDVIAPDRSRSGEVATALIAHVLPKRLETLPAERILELRSELMLSRVKYRFEVQRLISDLEAVSSDGDREWMKKQAIALAEEKIDEVREIYRRQRIETLMAGITVTLTPPALVSCLASVLGIGLAAPAGIAAALGMFTAERLLSLREAKRERRVSGWSYLADLADAV